jgi:RNA-directed DNA polymerase
MQQNLFDLPNHPNDGEASSESVVREAQQVLSAPKEITNQTNSLLEKVSERDNLKQAFKAVKRNKGAAGVDKMSTREFAKDLDNNIENIRQQLLSHEYQPNPVKGVNIPKPKGGVRQLGIPTVKDRVVQQAILQVLTPIIDPTFSNHSYGFRPKRSAKDAVLAAKQYVGDGRTWVADIDLEKFFDKVNHDILMRLVAEHIQDKALLSLIRQFLTAGMMENGLCVSRKIGTPQGGPLSPMLANIMLHQLDAELEKRGHTFCRYADDCNVYVRSQAAAKRILASITAFIESKLKLTVNREKSAVDKIQNRQFLGFRILKDSTITIAPESRNRIKTVIRQVAKRNRSASLSTVIREINSRIIGWFHYYKIAEAKSFLGQLDAWIRRKLRVFRLKQRKRKYSIKTFLTRQGANQQDSWALAKSDKGWWRKSFNPIIHRVMSNRWFGTSGLKSLLHMFVQYRSETAVCDIARTVV